MKNVSSIVLKDGVLFVDGEQYEGFALCGVKKGGENIDVVSCIFGVFNKDTNSALLNGLTKLTSITMKDALMGMNRR